MPTNVPSIAADSLAERSLISVASDLFKARLTSLVLVTTAVGFYAGTAGTLDLALLIHTLLGTAFLAAGAAALNQWQERDYDAQMRRTQGRPLPSGRLQAPTVAAIGSGCAVLGLAWLAVAVNSLTSVIGATTLIIYLGLYTPLKRMTTLNTVVGAVPGALPPLMGWAGARDSLDLGGWSLFAILACWQLPHFLAIAWMYREDYARAGFLMLPVVDADGRRTSGRAFLHTLALLPVSLIPFGLHLAGALYLTGALVVGLAFSLAALQFRREVSDGRARRLFYVSILYLPLLLGLMVMDKIK